MAQALALAKCRFSPGSTAKRFIAWAAEQARYQMQTPSIDVAISAKAMRFLNRLAHSYRNQIGECMAVGCEACTNGGSRVILFCRCGDKATVYTVTEGDEDLGCRVVAKCHGFRREIELTDEHEKEHRRIGYLIRSFGAHRCDEAAAYLATLGFQRYKHAPEDRDVAVDALLDAGWERGEAMQAFDELLKWRDVYQAVVSA